MIVFALIFLKMCLAPPGRRPGPRRGACGAHQTPRSAAHKNVGGGGGATSASAFSLGRRRKNPKKVENPSIANETSELSRNLTDEHSDMCLPYHVTAVVSGGGLWARGMGAEISQCSSVLSMFIGSVI